MHEQSTHAPDMLKAEDWAGEMGANWLANLTRFESMLAPIGAALLARADYQPGQRVLDIGCGGGGTTIAIGKAVAPAGEVLGIDISPDLAAYATRRAAEAGASNVRFTCTDAASAMLPDAPFDRLFSRFGCMFFAEPIPAFTNLRRLLKPGARIDLGAWASPHDNPWMSEAMVIVRKYVDLPPPVPRAPGPFAFEDLDYLRAILAGAGFASPDVATYEGLQPVGGVGSTPDQALDFVMTSMAAGRALVEQSEAVRSIAGRDLLALFKDRHEDGRGVMMPCKVWLVTAEAR